MAVTSFHAETGKWLTSLGRDAVAGSVHHLTIGSRAYDLPISGFGYRSSQFTRYTLSEPVATNEWGEPLFDLDTCDPRCPLDNSSQLRAPYWPYPPLSDFAAQASGQPA